jgi:CRP/FNR family transcriptional regulator, cyclic AMP receptor protein
MSTPSRNLGETCDHYTEVKKEVTVRPGRQRHGHGERLSESSQYVLHSLYANLFVTFARPPMSLATLLKQIDIFFDLSPAQLKMIADLCEERRCQAGETICEENSAGSELFIIVQGEVEIKVNPAVISPETAAQNQLETIATLRRGQSFGEIALVDQGLRTATAICATETQLLVLPYRQLTALCEANPPLGYHLMRNLAADLALKIRNTDLHIREQLLYGPKRSA